MIVSWTVIKEFVDNKNLSIQWFDDGTTYFLKAFDGYFWLECLLNKNNLNNDILEFESTYKALGNESFSDIDGIPFMRLKTAKKGWTFWAVPIEITTSTLSGSVYSKNADDTDIPGITCKIYNSNDEEITTAGLLNANLNTCVKTVMDFEPSFDYEMIGGALRVNSNPSQDVRLWVIGAPDIAAEYGGSKEFASGINLKFMATDDVLEIDGRVTKYISYNSSTHEGKLRVLIKHPAGTQVNLQIIIHTYRL